MAALFTAANSQAINNSAPGIVSTGYPLSVGAWVNLAAVGAVNRTVFGASDTGTTNNYLLVRMNAAEQIGLTAADGGAESSFFASTLAAGVWTFLLARFIAADNRKISTYANGAVVHGSSLTVRAPTGLDALAIGCTATSGGNAEFWDGLIGELWYAYTDIQPGGAQLQDDLLRQLAYGGPFSVPHIDKDIIEYRSLRKYPSSEGDEMGEVFHGAAGRQTWTNTNGVTIGHHPPLPYWYPKPPGARPQTPWQRLSRGHFLHDQPPPWPPPSDFSQPELYVTQGTQRF